MRRQRLKGKQYPEDAGGSETVLIALTVGRRTPEAAVRCRSLLVAGGRSSVTHKVEEAAVTRRRTIRVNCLCRRCLSLQSLGQSFSLASPDGSVPRWDYTTDRGEVGGGFRGRVWARVWG